MKTTEDVRPACCGTAEPGIAGEEAFNYCKQNSIGR
jgi:hypothetical protein